MTSQAPKGNVTRLVIVIAVVIALIQASYLYVLSRTRVTARSALEQTLQDGAASDADRIAAALKAFDRMTADIFFAASGPYLFLAILTPCVIFSLVRLRNNLAATEEALKALLKSQRAKNGA